MRWTTTLRALCLASAMATAMPPSASAASVSTDLARFGRLPRLEMVELSPDGASIASVVGDDTHRQVQVRDRATRKLIRVIDAHGAKVRALDWAGSHHLLITTSQTAYAMGVLGPRQEFAMVVDIDLIKARVTPLLDDRNGLAHSPLNTIRASPIVRIIDGRPMAFLTGESFPGSQGVATLYRVDLDRRVIREVALGEESTWNWLIDAKGEPVARTDYDQTSGVWRLRLRSHSGWKEAQRLTAPIDTPEVLGFTPDRSGVLVRELEADGWNTRSIALEGGRISGPIADYQPSLIMGPDEVPVGRAVESEMALRYVFFSSAERDAWRLASAPFAGETVRLESWSDDRKQVAVSVEGAKNGAGIFLVDLTTKTADWLGDEYDGVGPEEVSDRRVIDYSAADGLTISAYLTLPRGKPATNLPLIVLVHGGPASRDGPGFDWWSQAMASQGYAVLQPQFRGSGDFDMALLTAGFGQWGRKMQTDLSDGVRWLVKRGEVDPKRVCIVGASYGGYAALAGATLDPGVYRCAASLAGPADLRRMLTWEADRANGSRNAGQRYWSRFMGAKTASDPTLDAISPARHADAATIPVLLIHGLDDTVVDYGQSRLMAEALQHAGKPVEFVTLKGEDHWLSKSETRLQMLQAVGDFLRRNNPPG